MAGTSVTLTKDAARKTINFKRMCDTQILEGKVLGCCFEVCWDKENSPEIFTLKFGNQTIVIGYSEVDQGLYPTPEDYFNYLESLADCAGAGGGGGTTTSFAPIVNFGYDSNDLPDDLSFSGAFEVQQGSPQVATVTVPPAPNNNTVNIVGLNPTIVGGGFPPSIDTGRVRLSFNNDFDTSKYIEVFVRVRYTAGPVSASQLFLQIFDTGAGNVIDVATVGFTAVGEEKVIRFFLDNSLFAESTFNMLIFNQTPGGISSPAWEFDLYDFNIVCGEARDYTKVIREVVLYEDNVETGRQYFKYDGTPHTLIGSFLANQMFTSEDYLCQIKLLLEQVTAKEATLDAFKTYVETSNDGTTLNFFELPPPVPPNTVGFIGMNLLGFSLRFWGAGGKLNNVDVPDGFEVDFPTSGLNKKAQNNLTYELPTSADSNGYQRITLQSLAD